MKKRKTIPPFFFIAFLILIAPILIFFSNKALAIEAENASIDLEEIKEGFNYTFKTLGYVNVQDPADSTLNPDNDFLKIPRYQFNLELRPDISLDLRRLKLVVKPRLTIEHQRWEDGNREGDHDTDDDWFINEWLISLNLFDGLFASYGRENLQWGPSYLISPSNPFFRDNGKSNPKREIPGMDFARLVWVSNNSFSASFIANTNEGRQEFLYDFEPAYALKLDYTNYRKYISLIASYREEDRARLGAYAGWTVSSALMIYGEASVSQGTDGLYPVKDPGTPFGIEMRPLKDDESSPEGIVLLGGSYTFEAGPTLTAEYVFNSAGYDDDEADLYYELRRLASRTYHFPGPITLVSRLALTQASDPGLRLLRKNYIMLQYQQHEIRDILNVIFRYTYNIDDQSSRLIPIIEYNVGDHAQLFMIGNQNFGSKDTEFRSFLDYSWMLGIEYTF